MNRTIVIFGIITIFLSLITWALDLYGFIEPCIYCRTERTVIGLLGILLIIPIIPYLSRYLSLVLGFFGAYVASEQAFLDLMDYRLSSEFYMASVALLIIIAQMILVEQKRLLL